MFESWYEVLSLVIYFALIVLFIRWSRKSEKESLENQVEEVIVHKATRWNAVGIAVIFGPVAVLATRMAYWNIRQLGWTQGTIVGCILTVVLDILFVGLILVAIHMSEDESG